MDHTEHSEGCQNRLTFSERVDLQQQDASARIKRAMKRRIGRGGMPAKEVATRAGHPNTDRLYSQLDTLRDTTPRADDFVKYGAILGPDFLNEVFGSYGMGGMRWLDPLDACPLAFGQTVVRYVGTHLDYVSDGMLDERELPDLSRRLLILGSGAMELHARLATHRGILTLR